MDQLHLLFLLSFSMLVGSFISGTVPMAFKMSDAKSRLLALMGSGILVGTALSIIIPEGIDAIYAQPRATDKLDAAGVHSFKGADDTGSSSRQVPPQEPVDTWIIGVSLVTGFVLMLFIDQFSLYQSQTGFLDSSNSSSHNPQQFDYSLACQDDNDDMEIADNSDDEKTSKHTGTGGINFETTSETKPITDEIDTHRILMRNVDTSQSINSAKPGRNQNHCRSQIVKARKQKVTPTLGLVIHAAADGIALGAAATTSHRDTEMIIFLAIMLHKAPAAFSLVVFLLHRGLKHSTIRRHLLAFSLSAPLAALLTYFGLSQSGKEALRRNNATGIAMLFSAGTFLYVATVHVLPELVNDKLLTRKEILFLVGGSFLPLLLAQTV